MRAGAYHVGGPDTESNEQLVRGDDCATNGGRDGLGLVHGNAGGERTDTEATDQSADSELRPDVIAGDLNDDTDDVEESPEGDGELAANLVGKRSGDEAAKQGTNAEKTDDGTVAGRTEVAIGVGKTADEIAHGHDTRDLTRFVTEHEATHGCNGTHDEGNRGSLPGASDGAGPSLKLALRELRLGAIARRVGGSGLGRRGLLESSILNGS